MLFRDISGFALFFLVKVERGKGVEGSLYFIFIDARG